MILINDFRVALKIPDVKPNDMCKNYGATDTILDTFDDIDIGTSTSLKVNILNKIIFKIKFKI